MRVAMKRAITRATASLLVAAVTATTVWAHGGATGIVKERMDGMVVLAKSMKELVAISRSGSSEADRIAEVADAIRVQSGAHMTQRFPKGSMQMASEASLEIWEDWARFEALAMRLDGLAAGIAASTRHTGPASGVAFSVSDPLPSVDVLASLPLEVLLDHAAKTCASCHKDFRIKK